MKNLSKIILVSFVFLATFLISCDKEVSTTSVTTDTFAKGTITGFVYASLNLSTYGYEFAPAGTRVIVTFANSNLITGAAGNYIDTVEVDANGSYTAIFPSDADGVTVTLKAVDFIYDQVQPLNSKETTLKKYYVGPSSAATTVKAGDYKVIELTYADPTQLANVTKWVTISGKISANYDLSIVNEVLPAGINVLFTCTGWSKSVTLGANGTYTVDVPNNVATTIEYNFLQAGKDGGGIATNYRYKGTKAVSAYTSDQINVNVDLGVGVAE